MSYCPYFGRFNSATTASMLACTLGKSDSHTNRPAAKATHGRRTDEHNGLQVGHHFTGRLLDPLQQVDLLLQDLTLGVDHRDDWSLQCCSIACQQVAVINIVALLSEAHSTQHNRGG